MKKAVKFLLPQAEAERYLGRHAKRFFAKERRARYVWIPHTKPGRPRYRIDDLDSFLEEDVAGRHEPAPRLGFPTTLDVFELATFLSLSDQQVRALAKRDALPHRARRKGQRYRFQVGEVIAKIRGRWMQKPPVIRGGNGSA